MHFFVSGNPRGSPLRRIRVTIRQRRGNVISLEASEEIGPVGDSEADLGDQSWVYTISHVPLHSSYSGPLCHSKTLIGP